MQNTSTEIDELKKLDPCSEGFDWARKQKSLADAWETCERADWMFWYLKRKRILTKPQAVELAIKCAERVIYIFEKKYPTDKRPRQAIEAAQAWLSDPSDENKKRAYAAYAAASDAAYAAYASDAYAAYDAAYAAAYASDAAYDAAYAASDAASDAAYAASAASDAAAYAASDAAARATERKAQADIIRSIVKNPFK